jgi:hypothetical protein
VDIVFGMAYEKRMYVCILDCASTVCLCPFTVVVRSNVEPNRTEPNRTEQNNIHIKYKYQN